MDFPDFTDDETRKSPAETRIIELRAEPWPDGRRTRVHVQISPFKERPNLEIQIFNRQGLEELASVQLIEIIDPRFVITMHPRPLDPNGNYLLSARLYYPDLYMVDQQNKPFFMAPADVPPDF